jgi:hypothetical protein
MLFVSRAEWGAKAPRGDYTYVASTNGVKVHYEGTAVPADLAGPDQHGRCAGRVRAIQASHMANTAENYMDIAYSDVVCPHGYVFEGRGLHHKTGANGNSALNFGHYAVCAMVGDSGLTQPTDAQLNGIRDSIERFQRDGGAGGEIKGHRDGYATSCPGGPLYAWVQAGAPRPGGGSTQPSGGNTYTVKGGDTLSGIASAHGVSLSQLLDANPSYRSHPNDVSIGAVLTIPAGNGGTPAPAPKGPPFVHALSYNGRGYSYDEQAKIWQAKMAARTWAIGKADGYYGPNSSSICRQFQELHGLPVTGVVDARTWAETWND